ncbi:poly(A)-specific ribonuclease PARN-like [Zingiber officinale]|uniref:poly(A)-specific ribonuclease PARN-like n=1 Tax=Zingiber officinale TaxID=94328 RepID=UPI001C4DB9C1|nr:poly(A)-specific ribonuclease PARN-like [Zingiber officinale]
MKNKLHKWHDSILRSPDKAYIDKEDAGINNAQFQTKDVLEDLRKNTEKRIKSSVGFRHVVDLLASAGKLIVGHNCLLDLAHIYNKFFGPLPSSLTEFVQAVHEKLPHTVDTKHLFNSNQTSQHLMKKNSKSLSSAFSLLCPNVSSNFQTTSKSYLRFEVQTDEIR